MEKLNPPSRDHSGMRRNPSLNGMMEMDGDEEECQDRDIHDEELEVPVRKKYKYSIQLASALLENMQLTTTNDSTGDPTLGVEEKEEEDDYDALLRKKLIQNYFPVSELSSHERCLQDFISSNTPPAPISSEHAIVVYQPSRFTQWMHLPVPSTEDTSNIQSQDNDDDLSEDPKNDMMDLDEDMDSGIGENGQKKKKKATFAGAVSHGEWFL